MKDNIKKERASVDAVVGKPTPRPKAAPAKKPTTMHIKNGNPVAYVGIGAGLLIAGGIGAGIHALATTPGASSTTGKITVSSDKVSDVMGTVTVDGKTSDVTVRDAMLAAGLMNPNEDGSFDTPGAEAVITVARNRAMSAEADARGIKVTDEDVKKYLKDNMGSDDIKAVAEVYEYTEDELRTSVEDAIKLKALYDEVTDNPNGVGYSPEPPAENLSSEEYYNYITGLAGEAFDTDKGTWAKKDSAWAKGMGDFTITTNDATFEAATKAHEIAYDKWQSRMDEVSGLWNDFCNDVYKDVTITIGTGISDMN